MLLATWVSDGVVFGVLAVAAALMILWLFAE